MSSSTNYTFYKIADSPGKIDFSSTNLAEIEVNGKRICLSRQGDAIHACAAKCPHAGGTLAEGYLDVSGNIVCPLHRYRFNMQTGRNISGEGYYLKTFPIEIRDDGVFVGIVDGGLFGWMK